MKRKVVIFLLVVLMLAGCAGGVVSPRSQVVGGEIWPTRGWQTSTPQEQGLDPVLLEEMQAAIREKKINLHSLLIIRNGYIVSETYYGSNRQNTLHTQYSVTKSFISTLTGIAFDQGKLTRLDQPVFDLLPGQTFENSDAAKQSMTLENLLTMTSGLDWEEGDPVYREMYMSPDWVKMVMDLPMEGQPGEEFVYCSGCSHILAGILYGATGQDLADFARENLFEPLGIKNYRWENDRQGIPIGGWGLELTARDMAKLGYLYLHEGKWEDKTIVSSSWVQAATKEHISTGGRLGYGYQWWTYPTHGAYTALGRDGQTIFVVPELDMVIVTTAEIHAGHDPIFELIDNYILPAAEE